jgi:hypothetical protein
MRFLRLLYRTMFSGHKAASIGLDEAIRAARPTIERARETIVEAEQSVDCSGIHDEVTRTLEMIGHGREASS